MRPAPLLLAVWLTLTAAATAHADQLRLSWDHCFGDGNVYNRAFACDTDAGTERLIGSYVLDEPAEFVSGYDVRVDFRTQGGVPLPAWWQFVNPGSCRAPSLRFFFNPSPSPGPCADHPWIGNWGGGVTMYRTNTSNLPTSSPGHAQLRASGGVVELFDVPAGEEVFAFDIRIDHARTVGTSGCSGCNVPVCITFSHLTLTSPPGFLQHLLPDGNTEVWRSTVTWQGASPSAALVACDRFGRCEAQVICAIPTPVQNRTWGTLKSLYR